MTSSNTDSLLPLDALALPELPSWFPLAWGWWAAFASVIAVFAAIVFYLRWKRKRLAPKKTALLLIQREKPAAALELVRQAALCYFPREQIAHLTGKEWYEFLDSQVDQPLFSTNSDLWQNLLYSKQPVDNHEELVQHCYQWVEQALPPKKRGA
ncbi:DUF4381 domain-containing protein [Vibrio panuliri]|uniref:DUF4381 domain-containing protein n=1 Tax=Vibrio panuliri TaxID=1381081 RepID=A0A1Q9HB86_9VIBR|nr:DUF4381 domain-containing protein [Vibrio panuliri]KAB1457649.1 DUF4381 domain-containing protein [Vibrio panuliri]OLQ86439.1 hypothetical protein BIY22_12400 [Vibrio panuliri]OLQ87297.1 hypothetical protein BIY20_14220 [Vibrio panuliri]